MKDLEELEYVKAWGAFVVCATVGGALAGAVVGMILGIIVTALHGPRESIPVWSGVAGFFAGLPVSYAFFRLFVSRMIVSPLSRRLRTTDEEATNE